MAIEWSDDRGATWHKAEELMPPPSAWPGLYIRGVVRATDMNGLSGIEDGGPSAETFAKHLADEVNAAHVALDRLGAASTKRVLNRTGDGDQIITIGLSERIASLPKTKTEQRSQS